MNTGPECPLYEQYVGIDIAAQSAKVAVLSGHRGGYEVFGIKQTAQERQQLPHKLLAAGCAAAQTLVVMEATGNYWMRLATALHDAGFAVSVINPSQAHHFAQALLKRAKTDAVDAQTLALLASRLQPMPWTPAPAVYEELQQRLSERDSLLNIRQQLRNQLHALRHRTPVVAAVEARLLALLDTLQTQLKDIETEIELVMNSDLAWAASARLLRTIKGVGLITAAWLMIATHNFTDCQSPEQLSAYAGLVPYPRQSGTSLRGKACIGHAGHARLRHVLYMASLSAAQYNPGIKTFYERLRSKGKPIKVARCAAARKLIHIAWAVVTKHTPFDPTYHQKLQSQLQAA